MKIIENENRVAVTEIEHSFVNFQYPMSSEFSSVKSKKSDVRNRLAFSLGLGKKDIGEVGGVLHDASLF